MELVRILISFFYAIYTVYGVQLNVDPAKLALSFLKVADYETEWECLWPGYDRTKNRIYLFGGDRGPVGAGLGQNDAVYYDIALNKFVKYALGAPLAGVEHMPWAQDYTQIGSTMYRIAVGALYSFNMESEKGFKTTITTPASGEGIALCTDGDRWLYAVGNSQLYIYDIYNLDDPVIKGPTLKATGREEHSCSYVNNAIYVIGGSITKAFPVEKAIINLGEPIKMSFSTFKDNFGLLWGQRTLSIGDYIYIIGGTRDPYGATAAVATNKLQILNTNNGALSVKTTLRESRMYTGQVMDRNGKMYVFGGGFTTKATATVKLRRSNEKSNIGVSGVCENPLRGPDRRRLAAKSQGDPHFTSFRGKRYDFQGAGCYYYVSTCPDISAPPLPFALRGEHFKCNSVARCIRDFYIDIIANDGSTIIETIDVKNDYTNFGTFKEIDRGNGLTADFYASPLNGGKRTFYLKSTFAKENGCGKDFELIIGIYHYNGGEYINIYISDPECYKCEACGLEGYYGVDANSQFDFVKGDKLGTLASSINEFGYSWYYGDKCLGDPLAPGAPFTTEAPIDVLEGCATAAVQAACDALLTEDEFAACCHNWNECGKELTNCVFDVCALLSDQPTKSIVEIVNEIGRPSLEFLCAQPNAPNNVIKQCTNPYRAADNNPVRRRLGAKSSGDPHYSTFDGVTHHFQGPGCYYYVTQCPTLTTHLPFNVRGIHWQCNGRARCVRNVFIDIIATDASIIKTIDIENYQPGMDVVENINTGGIIGKFTLSKKTANQRIFELTTDQRPNGNAATCGSDLKLSVKYIAYHGSFYVQMYVWDPKCYECEVCGLYGFFSHKAADDFVVGPSSKTYVQVSNDLNTFGYSWYYGDKCLLPPNPDELKPEEPFVSDCDADADLKARVTAKCNTLMDVEFKECCTANPTICDEGRLFSCVFDTCAIITDNGNNSDGAIDNAIDDIGRKDMQFVCTTPDVDNPVNPPPVDNKNPIVECTKPTTNPNPNLPPQQEALGFGEPHYRTFDGRRYDFQGDGCYNYISTCPTVNTYIPFNVRGVHFKCNAVATCISNIFVDLLEPDGTIIVTIDIRNDKLVPGPDGEAINGENLNGKYILSQPSATDASTRVFELVTSARTNCESDLKFTINIVPYGANSYIDILVVEPLCYKCEICGLFGFFSDLGSGNDLILGPRESTQVLLTSDIYKFAYSWYYGETCDEATVLGTTREPIDILVDCTAANQLDGVKIACNNLFNGEFDECCNNNNDPDFNCADLKLTESCLLDTCAALISDHDAILTIDEAINLFARKDIEFICTTDPQAPAIDCVWNAWSQYNPCNVNCGGGIQTRHRTIKTRASNGGVECNDGDNMETKPCNTQVCPNVIEKCVPNQFQEQEPARRRLLRAKVQGDPHFTTWDGLLYDFQGAGCYNYMTSCPTVIKKLPYNLRAQHFQCNAVAKCIKNIYIDLFDINDHTLIQTINIRDNEQEIESTPNQDIRYTLLKTGADREFSLFTSARENTLCGADLHFKLRFIHYGNAIHEYVNINIDDPLCYKCQTCGLNGFYSGLQTDDLLLGPQESNEVELADNINDFGKSWYYGSDCLTPGEPPINPEPIDPPIDPIDPNQCTELDEVKKACQDLFNIEFAECCKTDPNYTGCVNLQDSCIFDTCAELVADDLKEAPNAGFLTVQEAIDAFAGPDLKFMCETDPDAPKPKIDCQWSDWSPLSPCSVECGGGTQSKTRTIETQAANGGLECSGSDIHDGLPCNGQECPQPTKEPTLAPCPNNDVKYNIQFVLDESGSINRDSPIDNYERAIDFVINLINNDINSQSPISVMTYSTDTVQLYSFGDNQNDNRISVKEKLENEKLDYLGDYTDTNLALNRAIEEFKTFFPNGDNILFLITDGVPNCNPTLINSNCNPNVCQQNTLLTNLNIYNIRVVIIGITDDFDSIILNCLTQNNNDIFEINDFNSQEFKQIEPQIRDIVCPNVIPGRFEKYNFLPKNNNNNNNNLTLTTFTMIVISSITTVFVILVFYACFYCFVSNKNMSLKPKYEKVHKNQIVDFDADSEEDLQA